MEPATIAAQLREIAIYFELDGDRHRAGAYDRASKSIEAANGLHRLVEEGRLEDLPGVGPSIARVVGDLFRRGNTTVLERLREKWPTVVVELALLPKVGAQRARKLFQAFQPADLEAIAGACRAGAVRELPGFGTVSEARILEAIEQRHLRGAQILLVDATDSAASLAAHLRAEPSVARVEVAGPVRRACEIVDHLAFAVVSDAPDAVMDRLASFALVTSIDRETRVGYLAGGMRAHVRVGPANRLGWELVQATGSPAHVDGLLARARERGIDLDALAAPEERRVYLALGLPWIPPELRDGTDELAGAAAGDTFADLVTDDDIHDDVPLSHDLQRRQALDRRDGARRRRARLPGDHHHRSLGRGVVRRRDRRRRPARAARRDRRDDRRAREDPARHRGRHPRRRRDRRASGDDPRARPRDRERAPALQARRARDHRAPDHGDAPAVLQDLGARARPARAAARSDPGRARRRARR